MNKDWTGNKKSTFATLGASSHSAGDREQHDYYATEPSTINDLFAIHKFDDAIWEPACGGGICQNGWKNMENQLCLLI